MDTVSIKIAVVGFVCNEGTFDDNCHPERANKDLLFVLNKHGKQLTINIDNKQAYIVDSDVAAKILELITSTD